MLLSDLGEDLGRSDVTEIVGQFKVTVCTSTLSVDLE